MRSETIDPRSRIDVRGLVLVVIVLILTAISAYPQNSFTGRVAEVIDGRTFIIEVPNAKIRAVLQYIEVPEREQALSETVREHLSAMILGKTVEFKPLGFNTEQTVGKLTLGGVDVGAQLLRDGAAWHAIYEKNGQPARERAIYEENEARAKDERRGVWGEANLVAAWEFRAERERAEAEQKRKENERVRAAVAVTNVKIAPRPIAVQNYSDFEAWSDIRSVDREAGVGGLIRKYDDARRFGYILTTQAQISVTGTEKAPYLDFRIGYVYGYNAQGKVSAWAVAVLSDADEYKFVKSSGLTVYADKEKIVFGKAFRYYGDTGAARRESLVYVINRAAIVKIANAVDVKVKVGTFSGNLGNKLQNLARNILNSAE
jgi:endonuclease YncB( thermonuclease family)